MGPRLAADQSPCLASTAWEDVTVRRFSLILALAVPAATHGGAAHANEFATPPPNHLYELQRRNQSQPWLRVTADSSRLMLKARRIDEAGLGDLRSRKSDPPPPSLIAWRSIAKIEKVSNHEVAGAVTGFLLGGTVGLIPGAASGEPASAMLGAAVMGGLGAWQGGRIGKRMVHEWTWYVGEPVEASSPPAVDTATVLAHPPPAPTATAPMAPPPGVLKACARITSDDRIRMQADFGQFQGFASVVGPEGLEGLRADGGGHSKSAVPTGLVRWGQIDRLEKRGGSSGKWALSGALMVGLLGGVTAGAAASLNGSDAEVRGGIAAGAAVGALLGAGLGALLGAPIPAWHLVYERPSGSQAGLTSK